MRLGNQKERRPIDLNVIRVWGKGTTGNIGVRKPYIGLKKFQYSELGQDCEVGEEKVAHRSHALKKDFFSSEEGGECV